MRVCKSTVSEEARGIQRRFVEETERETETVILHWRQRPLPWFGLQFRSLKTGDAELN